MATLSELQARLEALRKVRATGVHRLTHGETSTEFRTDAELAKAIGDLERQIAAASRTPIKTIYISRKVN